VNTAGELQSRASDTGDDAQAQVSNQIDVVSATGSVTSGNVTELVFVVKKSPGSDPIDLAEATAQYTSSADSTTLSEGDGLTIQNTDGSPATDTVLSETDERKQIVITLDGTDPNPSELAEGDDARVEFVDQSGASTVYGVNVPDVITGDYVQV
jgi:archaellin